MASIEKRKGINGDSQYRVRIRMVGAPDISQTFSKLTDAKSWAAKTENMIREDKYFSHLKAKQHTLAEAIDKYMENKLPERPKLERFYKVYLELWKKFIGDYTLSQITPAIINEGRNKIAEVKHKDKHAKGPATLNRYLAALSSVMTYTFKDLEWIEVNPMAKVSKLSEPRGRVRYLSDEERKALLEEAQKAENPYLYPVVVVALSTGARKMEVLSLTWDNVDFEERRAILQDTKNGERRSIPLVSSALKVLQELYEKRKNSPYVFPSKNGLAPFDIKRSWEKAVENAKLDDFRFHDLRHTAASYLIMNSASLGEIADILGHKTLAMVKRYAHLSDKHKQSVVEKMNKKIFGE